MGVSIVRLLKYKIENVVCTSLYWKAEPIARHNTTAWMQMHIILAAVCIVNWLLAALFEWAKRIHEQKQRIHSHLINELNQVNWQKKRICFAIQHICKFQSSCSIKLSSFDVCVTLEWTQIKFIRYYGPVFLAWYVREWQAMKVTCLICHFQKKKIFLLHFSPN